MNQNIEDTLRSRQLFFIGRLMAGLSHEFANHLAIISESGGLMKDLLGMEASDETPGRQRLLGVLETVKERVEQATRMVKFFNRFVHRMDQPVSSFDVNQVIEEEIYLMHRFARQKCVDLKTDFGQGLPPILNNPSLLQHAVFCLLQPLLESLGSGGAIRIATSKHGSSVKLTVNSTGPPAPAPAGHGVESYEAILPVVLEKLGAELRRTSGQGPAETAELVVSSLPGAQESP